MSSQMQFGIFSVSDITRDPTTGRTPSEAERKPVVKRVVKRAAVCATQWAVRAAATEGDIG